MVKITIFINGKTFLVDKMAYTMWADGKCAFCKTHAEFRCDNCNLFICDSHLTKRFDRPKYREHNFLCPNCVRKKGKLVIDY